ncbi:hypothetical protein CHGG_06508 [Chaetomium globosum CBS 148.51]|uniref:Structural maintenance of chromosomes protein 5 n=1 Tax=Chaetomium globosum (strain ATCC 6205 / CBS 148.51 / DSM 1962 / NBRC 6347 / NRRL 1970) TaxID=306901 RepID=Q2H4A7_CHAGB|nr:uncharacterized protein CHGG_06508 [Chaetomium globosum CBS 148.51]EAQ89889.1 hypothetical protein CHGG_06508 [Chaetomium globosum CBS 148.51]
MSDCVFGNGSREDEPLPVPSLRTPANQPAGRHGGADPFRFLRLRGGDGSLGYDQDDDEASSVENDVASASRRTAISRPRNGPGISGFQPGAIVRVKVENFVTYEEAEFFLGPNLNMVIGPNGTGKSSLVCAICLGLGYSSNVLGRASAFGEFVKHGKDEAGIEVELQKLPEHSENPIVGLTIRREDNSRKFTINGQRASHREIQKLMRSFRIQIDNLCQFLPQDKVAEFAALTPIELLEKTLHAAAPEEMISWRAQLRDHFKLQKDTEHNGEKIREELRKMEARQQVLQADVEKLRERKAIQEAIEDYNKLRVVVKYYDARNKFKEAKVRKADAERSLRRLYDSVAPALAAVNRKQEYQAKVKLVVADRQRRLQAADAAANAAISQVEAVQTKSQELAGRKEAEQANFVAKRQELGRLRKNITDLEAGYRQAPPEFDAADWNRKIREQEHQAREKGKESEEAAEELKRVRMKATETREQLKRLQSSVQDLDSQQGQLLTQLKRINNDVAKGWEWLKDNQQSFEKEVFGPPMLTCSVKDKRYIDLVQSILQTDDFLCFTAQTREDHKKLSNQFYGEMGLSVTIRSCFTQYSSFKPPLPKEELSNLGFDGYVSDYLDGPEPVLAMLCSERKMHASAVSIRDITDEQFDQIQRAEKLIQFAAGRQLYRITRRREYGPGAVSTRVTQFAKGRFWADQPVDAAEKTELQREIEELRAQLAAMKEHYDATDAKYVEAGTEKKHILHKITELRSAKSELQREYTKWQTLPDKIRAQGSSRGITRKIMGIRKAREAMLEAQVILMEAESDVGVLKAKNLEITQQLEESKMSVKQIGDELNQQRNIAAEAKEEAVSILTEENKDELRDKAMGKTVEDIDQAIQVEKTKLEVIQASNPAALEEYERYAVRIERERVNQANHDIKMAELDERIRNVKSQWEPKLDQLVSQINDAFSYNFEQISCAGEVGVHKDEDFEKWAIEIKVKIPSMAQAPFRVVDEINQGMDPRNERMVHERMVEVACREHTSQYFLITPKLLSGLRYDERMRVHTIVSGEYVDSRGTEKMNFANFVKIQRRLAVR